MVLRDINLPLGWPLRMTQASLLDGHSDISQGQVQPQERPTVSYSRQHCIAPGRKYLILIISLCSWQVYPWPFKEDDIEVYSIFIIVQIHSLTERQNSFSNPGPMPMSNVLCHTT